MKLDILKVSWSNTLSVKAMDKFQHLVEHSLASASGEKHPQSNICRNPPTKTNLMSMYRIVSKPIQTFFKQLILIHGEISLQYPTRSFSCNFRRLAKLQSRFGCFWPFGCCLWEWSRLPMGPKGTKKGQPWPNSCLFIDMISIDFLIQYDPTHPGCNMIQRNVASPQISRPAAIASKESLKVFFRPKTCFLRNLSECTKLDIERCKMLVHMPIPKTKPMNFLSKSFSFSFVRVGLVYTAAQQ